MSEHARRCDAIVVGGGVAGAADAFFLARRGLAVLLLEKESDLGSVTTAKAAACFRAQWQEADFGRLVTESISFYERFAEETGLEDWDIGLRQNGWLFLSASPDAPVRFGRWVDGHRRLGVHDSELLVGAEIRNRFPWVSDRATAATFRARDGWLSPYEVTIGFARASGADVRVNTNVLRVVVDDRAVVGVETTIGLIRADRVVVACGPFSKRLLATAGVDLPLMPIRRQLAVIRKAPAGLEGAPMVSDADNHAYWRPEGGGAFLGMPLPEAVSEPSTDVSGDWNFPALVLDAVSRLTPGWTDVVASLTSDDVSVLAGQYTCTSDVRPVIGAVPTVRGLFVHTGDNGWGIEAAPAAGQWLAESVCGKNDPGSPYRVDRGLSRSRDRVVSDWP